MPDISRTERLSVALFYGVVLLLVGLVYLMVRPFLVPLGWAAVLAVLFYPWYSRLAARWGATWAALAGTGAVTVILIVPSLLLMSLVVREGLDALQSLQNAVAGGQFDWVNRAWAWLSSRLGQTGSDLPTVLREGVGRASTELAGTLGAVLRNVAVFFFSLFATLFALFYFFRDGHAIVARLGRALPFDTATNEQILEDARNLIHASVTVGLFIAAIQGFMGGVAFALVGIGSPAFWGTVMAFLALLPIIGTWPVWIPAVVWLFLSGHTVRALVLLALCAGLVVNVDNVLRPMLISGHARLSGLIVFVSVLGGVAAFGMLGVILGPIIFATATSVLDVYTRQNRRA